MNDHKKELGICRVKALAEWSEDRGERLPGTITISFLRVLSLSSLTSSDLSRPTVNEFDAATNAKTILATSSAVLPF